MVGDASTDAVAHLRRLRGLLLDRRDRANAMVAAIDRELVTRAKGLLVPPEKRLAYLEEHVRRATSVSTRAGPEAEQRAVRSLGSGLRSGRWAEHDAGLEDLDAVDLGLRLLVV